MSESMEGRVCGLYARVSTEEQSVEGQFSRLREWADRQGFREVREFSDVATGRHDAKLRPEQQELMAEAMARRVTVVATAKVDRWARSLSQLASSVTKLHERKVVMVFVDQGLSVAPGDPTGALVVQVMGAMAEWEGAIISERTRESLALKKKKGEHVGRPRKPCGVCMGDRDGSGKRVRFKGRRVRVCGSCAELSPMERVALVEGGPE